MSEITRFDKDQTPDNETDQTSWRRKLAAGGVAVAAALGSWLHLSGEDSGTSEANTPVPDITVERVDDETGSFLESRVEEGDTIWEVARAFQAAHPELADQDPREIVDTIVAHREQALAEMGIEDGDPTVVIPGETITYPLHDSPEDIQE